VSVEDIVGTGEAISFIVDVTGSFPQADKRITVNETIKNNNLCRLRLSIN
jgi:hypothetical protein